MKKTTPQGQIDFYFDFTSPYSYLAIDEIEALGKRFGHEVNWIPVLLGVLFKQTGAIALTEQHPWKAEYFLKDFLRTAAFRKLPFRPPSRFPQASQNPSRIMVWLQQTAPGSAVPFAREVFRLIFEQDGNIHDIESLAAIGRRLGIDEAGLRAATQDPAIKARFAANNEEAAARQVFGAPTFFIGDEQFWGNDRLPQVEWRLAEIAGGRNHHVLVDAANRKIETLSPEQALAEHGRDDVVFVDIRDPRELEREGMIEGAIHAPRGMVEFWVDPKSPYYRQAFTPDKRFVFYCAGGLRSALTTAAVADMGVLPRIAHIDGGFDAWKKAGGKVQAKPTSKKG
jgi:2-hydroxychromene-2-carboxylate isomerase/rhodanese-related sulfurtransferase